MKRRKYTHNGLSLIVLFVKGDEAKAKAIAEEYFASKAKA